MFCGKSSEQKERKKERKKKPSPATELSTIRIPCLIKMKKVMIIFFVGKGFENFVFVF